MLINRISRVLKNPEYIYNHLRSRGNFKDISDKRYLEMLYKYRTGLKLNLENPRTYNEKLQWLKLNDRNQKYTQLVDKYEVRKYIAEKIGEEYLVPLYGVWDSFEDINFNDLPNSFVLKANHTSGDFFICHDKNKIDYTKLQKQVDGWMDREYFWKSREWPYKNVKPKIIGEKLLEQDDSDELRDYRFFCFMGEPKFISVDFSIINKDKTRRNLYSLDWELLDMEISYPKEIEFKVKRPRNFEKMIELSRELSEKIPHVRIDFYNIDGQIYFGEMTFYHQSGFGIVKPESFNEKMGGWISIDKENCI